MSPKSRSISLFGFGSFSHAPRALTRFSTVDNKDIAQDVETNLRVIQMSLKMPVIVLFHG